MSHILKGDVDPLFIFNAKIDICIDEENRLDVIVKNIESNKITKKYLNNIDKLVSRVLSDGTFDSKLIELWADKNSYINDHKDSLAFFLLIIAKCLRSFVQNQQNNKNYSKCLDDLTLFLAGNLDCAKNNVMLRFLLLVECSSCAPSEASLGFLQMADTLLSVQHKFSVLPLKCLAAYNKAVAYSHNSDREKALEQSKLALAIVDFNTTEPTKEVLLGYLYSPAVHLQAELLSKMQFSYNSRTILNEYLLCRNTSTYKKLKALLLEAACWLEVDDKEKAANIISAIYELPDQSKVLQLLGSLLYETMRSYKPNSYICLTNKYVKDIYKDYQSIRHDCVKFILQNNIEKARKDFQGKGLPSNKSLLTNQSKYIRILFEVLKVKRDDIFQRHNLKDLVVDYLDILNKKDCIRNKTWQKVIIQLLKCLNFPMIINKATQAIDIKGHMANEIWGDRFKRYEPKRVTDILSKLNDNCLEAIEKQSCGCEDFCKHSDFLRPLLILELNAIGGLENEATFKVFDGALELYPQKYMFDYRKNERRGNYLLCLLKKLGIPNNHRSSEISHCISTLRNEFTWLPLETSINHKGLEDCISKIIKAWPSKETETTSSSMIGDSTNINNDLLLSLRDYKNIIADVDCQEQFIGKRSLQPVAGDRVEFVSLRRWNSYTPEISFSKGGGYFVFLPFHNKDASKDSLTPLTKATNIGIVIDPGFDFINNFFRQGFTLEDIDIILITHADSDHVNDFRVIADLLREKNKRGKGPSAKKIYTFMPLSCYEILKRYIVEEEFRRLYYDTVIVNIIDKTEAIKYILTMQRNGLKYHINDSSDNCNRVEIEPILASHDDHAGNNPSSWGYVIRFDWIIKDEKRSASIGFTGDSQWFPDFANKFADCELVCSHMGSFLGDDPDVYNRITHGRWESLVRKKNHPYFPGEILFLEQLRKVRFDTQKQNTPHKLVVLSEFGEEMKGMMRIDVSDRINHCLKGGTDFSCWENYVTQEKGMSVPQENMHKFKDGRCSTCHKDSLNNPIRTLPADVGLRASLLKGKKPLIHCAICERYVEHDYCKIEAYGHEEALFYVCASCHRSKPIDVRHKRYENIINFGKPVILT